MADKDEGGGDCTVCGLSRVGHSKDVCRACNGNLSHHTRVKDGVDRVSVDECWAGRARMAHAKRDAGFMLDEVEGEAVRRHPEWVKLTASGYR